MKNTVLFVLIFGFFMACNPSPTLPGQTTASPEAGVPVKVDATPVTSTGTGTGTGTKVSTDAALPIKLDAYVAPSIGTGMNTDTGTGTGTGTGTTIIADAGVSPADAPIANPDTNLVKLDTTPVNTPDAAIVKVDTNPVVVVLCGKEDFCNNGIDDDCDGYIDNCTRKDAGIIKVDADTTDRVQPVVYTPFCGASDTNNLPAGVPVAFFVNATDNVDVVGCSFLVNDQIVSEAPVRQASGSWRGAVVLPSGTSIVNARCWDAANNIAYPTAGLTVRAVGIDGGVIVFADAQAPTDTVPVTTGDAGTSDAQIVSSDAQAPTDAILTGCKVLVNGQVTALTEGQTIECVAEGVAGLQYCVSGMLSTCVKMSATTSGNHAIMDCRVTGTDSTGTKVGTVTLTGNVIGDLDRSGDINRVCVVGDSVGGWEGNHTLCLDFSPYTTFRYNFTNIRLPDPDNRITYLAYQKTVTDGGIVEGAERWDNNFVLLFSSSPENKCRMKDSGANKVVFSQ